MPRAQLACARSTRHRVGVWVLGWVCLLSACVYTQVPRAEYFAASLPGLRSDARFLSDEIGKRVAGELGERRAAEFIARRFTELGLAEVQLQAFEFPGRMGPLQSANVIAHRPGLGENPQLLVVGAHYDSVAHQAGRGASDNAVSIAGLFVLAEMLSEVALEHDLLFVAFGAEEPGQDQLDGGNAADDGPGRYGSRHFVTELARQDLDRIAVMINLDSIVGGDHLYIYSAQGARGWPRERVLKLARRLGVEFRSNPGRHPEYPVGTTGPWSDHAAFDAQEIPYAYFEATNWDIGDLDGYEQTQQVGQIWHTDNDTLAYIDTTYPGRIDAQATDALQLIYALIRSVAD